MCQTQVNNAITVTAQGKAKEIQENREYFKSLFINKHPNLIDFINSSDCALFRIKVDNYQYVSNFQNVESIDTRNKIFKEFIREKRND